MNPELNSLNLEANFALVRIAIAEAFQRSGRSDTITLVAASKTVDATRLEHAISLGQRVFGENRVHEGKQKWPALKETHPDIELHLLGPLQTNKARDAVALFDVIQSIDRDSVAQAVAKECDRQGRRPKVYIQVNTSRESQKSGVLPEKAINLIAVCRERCCLDVVGLMCIPSANGDPGKDFRLLREIAQGESIELLSMGMSSDYVQAIECGATHIRIGTALFGKRLALLQ